MKRAFVTGAAGFLGLNIVQQLQAKGWEITALHLPGEDLTYLSRFEVTPVAGDITDFGSLLNAMPEDVDAVFHTAADTSMWRKHQARQYTINVIGTENMCRAALARKAKRFVYTSSSSAFGYHANRFTELTPSNALECGMSYNRSKFLAEQVVKRAVDYGLSAVILNPGNIMGPYDLKNWSQMIRHVVAQTLPGYPPGKGTFAHAGDIARAHIAAVECGKEGANYLLGGAEASFEDVVTAIASIAGVDSRLKPLSKRRLKLATCLSFMKSLVNNQEPELTYAKYKRVVGDLRFDDSLARRTLGFETSSLSDMLRDSYDWLLKEELVH